MSNTFWSIDEAPNDLIADEYFRRRDFAERGFCHYCEKSLSTEPCKLGHERKSEMQRITRRHPNEIDEIGRACFSDSKRWFPHLHESTERMVTHFTLGLTGEAGEVADAVKKVNRRLTGLSEISAQDADRITDELADVIIYSLDLMTALGRLPGATIRNKQRFNEERFGSQEDADG